MEKLLELSNITLVPRVINNSKEKKGIEPNFFVTDSIDITPQATSFPIFTSPMESVVDEDTWGVWSENKIRPVLPRTAPLQKRLEACCHGFSAFSIKEAKEQFLDVDLRRLDSQFHICIDAGNGQDEELLTVAGYIKEKYNNQAIVMAGNIGCPDTWKVYNKFRIDYVRVGMSGGSLVKRDKLGFHYPLGSLLIAISQERRMAKEVYTKVIADGGITCHGDIFKAIALGADYVMIGREFAKLIEAAGPIYQRIVDDKGDKLIKIANTELGKFRGAPGFMLLPNKFQRQYSANTSLENQARMAGFASVSEFRAANPKIRISDAAWDWVRVESSISEWISEFIQSSRYAFLMAGDAKNWFEFKKNIKYGRIS